MLRICDSDTWLRGWDCMILIMQTVRWGREWREGERKRKIRKRKEGKRCETKLRKAHHEDGVDFWLTLYRTEKEEEKNGQVEIVSYFVFFSDPLSWNIVYYNIFIIVLLLLQRFAARWHLYNKRGSTKSVCKGERGEGETWDKERIECSVWNSLDEHKNNLTLSLPLLLLPQRITHPSFLFTVSKDEEKSILQQIGINGEQASFLMSSTSSGVSINVGNNNRNKKEYRDYDDYSDEGSSGYVLLFSIFFLFCFLSSFFGIIPHPFHFCPPVFSYLVCTFLFSVRKRMVCFTTTTTATTRRTPIPKLALEWQKIPGS